MGLTSCLITLGNSSRSVPVTWADQGENTLVNMYQGRREFPETYQQQLGTGVKWAVFL